MNSPMAFEIDLQNWAVNFALQDEAEAWCRTVAFPNGKKTISWPPSGEEGLRRAFLESVPLYLLAYSHRTSIEVIKFRLKIIAAKEVLHTFDYNGTCRKYGLSEDEVIRTVNKLLEMRQ